MLKLHHTPKQVASILRRYSGPKLAALSQVSIKTIYRLRNGQTDGPTVETLRRLNQALLTLKPKDETLTPHQSERQA